MYRSYQLRGTHTSKVTPIVGAVSIVTPHLFITHFGMLLFLLQKFCSGVRHRSLEKVRFNDTREGIWLDNEATEPENEA